MIHTILKQRIKGMATVMLSLMIALPLQTFAAMPALFYTSSFDAEVGDTVTFDLKVNPSSTVFTVGATLHYDPSLLTFVSASVDKNWLALSRVPYELSDTKNGVIQRTAGYPEGASGVTPFTHYTFRAKAVGTAKVTIKEGIALDAENNDAGLQQKEITVNITAPTKKVVTTKPSDTSDKQLEITLDLTGPTAHTAGSDYMLNAIMSNKYDDGEAIAPGTAVTGSTTVSLLNKMGSPIYTYTQNFGSLDATTTMQFMIPQTVLMPSDYDIVAEVRYMDAPRPVVANKEIGVLAKQVEQKQIEKIPEYMWPIIIALTLALIIVAAALYSLKSKQKKSRSK